MSKADALQAASKINGWLTHDEAEALYEFARNANGPIVEIGSCFGRSTAALGRGSMDGNYQPVYAVDSFVGVPEGDRPASDGTRPGPACSSPELLRSNLDEAGVNGLVHIIAKPSAEAVNDVPDGIAVLFIDGAHDEESVVHDIELFTPKISVGGYVVMHDASSSDPGVLAALDRTLTANSNKWLPIRRVGSAVVFQRRQETERLKIGLAMPGPKLDWGAAMGMMTASRGIHDIAPFNSRNGFDDMNTCWVEALNLARKGAITHFAMLHSDINPQQGWVDILANEMATRGADLISTVIAIKDSRGLTTTGVGDHGDPWNAFRRFTMREIHADLPETFSIADTPHPDKYLLHNTGCWLADLRNPAWWTADEDGWLIAALSFPIAAKVHPNGEVEHKRESEDWYFSRMLSKLPLKTFATRKVSATHYGDTPYPNNRPWGDYLFGDEATKDKWKK